VKTEIIARRSDAYWLIESVSKLTEIGHTFETVKQGTRGIWIDHLEASEQFRISHCLGAIETRYTYLLFHEKKSKKGQTYGIEMGAQGE